MKYKEILIITCLFLTGCFAEQTNRPFQLVNQVEKAVLSGDETVPLSSYGDWKELHLFGPYTPDELVHESLGRKFRGPSVGLSESHFLLILVDTNNSVSHALLPRSVIKAEESGVEHEKYIYVDYSLNEESEEIGIIYLPW